MGRTLVVALCFSIVFVFVSCCEGRGGGPLSYTHVSIANFIDEGVDLTVHCKSEEDDLGVHVVPYTREYVFRFRPNFWRTTRFFCGFRWRDQFKWFDIYVAMRDEEICSTCEWSIKEDGPCRLHKHGECYPWNK